MKKYGWLIICIFIFGCATRPDNAPIEDATNVPSYILNAGSSRNIGLPSTIQKPSAVVSGASTTTIGSLSHDANQAKPVAVTSDASIVTGAMITLTPEVNASSGWIAPTAGKSLGYKASNKGIDIYGNANQPIYAANDGKVVYSGNGLKGYGNLIIIKHDDVFLTAYAHNNSNLVKEGVSVMRGQKIASMGNDDNGKALLHFELRKSGKPIDPFILIKRK